MILALRGPQEVWLLGWSFTSFCTFIHSDGFENLNLKNKVYGLCLVMHVCKLLTAFILLFSFLPPSQNASWKQ